eukprot:scaffold2190_cov30-Prasinocladus_malaysianus.AAC.3
MPEPFEWLLGMCRTKGCIPRRGGPLGHAGLAAQGDPTPSFLPFIYFMHLFFSSRCLAFNGGSKWPR